MAEIAQYPNIFCKLSGTVTEADRKGWNKVDFLAYVHETLAKRRCRAAVMRRGRTSSG